MVSRGSSQVLENHLWYFQLLLFPAWARSAMRAAFRGPDEVEQQSECVILTFWMAHGASGSTEDGR